MTYDMTMITYMMSEASIDIFSFFLSSTGILSRIRLNFWIAWQQVVTRYLDKRCNHIL